MRVRIEQHIDYPGVFTITDVETGKPVPGVRAFTILAEAGKD